MKKLFLLLIPITLLTLCGCSDNSLYQRVYDLENNQNLLFDNDDWIIWRLDNIEQNLLNTWIVEETTRAEICVWLTDITVSTHQAKDLFECIGNWQGYCNCIEKYASCWAKLSDIPKEYQNYFNPECLYNE